MAFATTDDIVTLYGQEYLDNSLYGKPLLSAQTALIQAESLIKSYVPEGKQFKDPPPGWVMTACIDIAVYYISSDVSDGYSEEKYERFKFWIARLEKGALDNDGLIDVPVEDTPILSWFSSPRIMSRERTRGLLP